MKQMWQCPICSYKYEAPLVGRSASCFRGHKMKAMKLIEGESHHPPLRPEKKAVSRVRATRVDTLDQLLKVLSVNEKGR